MNGQCAKKKFCYTFMHTHVKCSYIREKGYGCTRDGKEYEWKKWCLGNQDAYRSYHGKRMCFGSKLKETGACKKGQSLAPDGYNQPGTLTPLEAPKVKF